jgi:hypothetical protein
MAQPVGCFEFGTRLSIYGYGEMISPNWDGLGQRQRICVGGVTHWLVTARYSKVTNERYVEYLSPLNLDKIASARF